MPNGLAGAIDEIYGRLAPQARTIYGVGVTPEPAPDPRLGPLLAQPATDTAVPFAARSLNCVGTPKPAISAYQFQFDRVKPPGKEANGAVHASELAYVFGTFAAPGRTLNDIDVHVSATMQQYWTNFAKNGQSQRQRSAEVAGSSIRKRVRTLNLPITARSFELIYASPRATSTARRSCPGNHTMSDQPEEATPRDGVRDVCARFPDAYWREVDEKHDYPTAFVQALTDAGYLAALIPEEYGGAGLPLSAACVGLEADPSFGRQRIGLSRADVHDGDTVAARERRTKAPLPARRRLGRAAAPSVRGHRTDDRFRYDAIADQSRARRRALRRFGPKSVDIARAAIGSHDLARAYDPARSRREAR